MPYLVWQHGMNETQVALVLSYDLLEPVVQLRWKELKHRLDLAEVVLPHRSEKKRFQEVCR